MDTCIKEKNKSTGINSNYRFSKTIVVSILFLFIFVSEANLYKLDYKQNDPLKDIINESDEQVLAIQSVIIHLECRVKQLKKSHSLLSPQEPYLIINTTGNEIDLKSKDQLIHRGKCSTGSYTLLKAGKRRQWLFKTPRGIFKVKAKMKDPVWYKPDWAYLEEGLPIPTRYTSDRYEKGVLGDRALALDDTHLIHGTLYKRLIGMPVTHGCIRLGDQELWIVYDNLNFGSKVYIY